MRTILGLTFSVLLVACSSGSAHHDGGTQGTSDDLSAPSGKDLATSMPDLTSSNGNGDGSMSSNGDGSTGSNGGVSCGSMSCMAGDSCCVAPNNGSPTYTCMATCGSGTFAASCDGPENCGGKPCCATVNASTSPPTGSSACENPPTTDCSMGNIDTQHKTLTTRFCHTPADCAGYTGTDPFGSGQAFDKCCTYPMVSYKFCAPAIATTQMGITCM